MNADKRIGMIQMRKRQKRSGEVKEISTSLPYLLLFVLSASICVHPRLLFLAGRSRTNYHCHSHGSIRCLNRRRWTSRIVRGRTPCTRWSARGFVRRAAAGGTESLRRRGDVESSESLAAFARG